MKRAPFSIFSLLCADLAVVGSALLRWMAGSGEEADFAVMPFMMSTAIALPILGFAIGAIGVWKREGVASVVGPVVNAFVLLWI